MPLSIAPLNLSLLPPEKKQMYSLLLEPRHRTCLEGIDPYGLSFGLLLAIGAEENNIPKGICLLSCYPDLNYAEIHSLSVTPPARRLGIGSQLIKAAEASALEKKCSLIQIQYRKEDYTTPFLEKILEKEKWAGPRKIALRFFFDTRSFHPPWFTHPPPLHHSFMAFPWGHLKKDEKQSILKNYKQGHFQPAVFPFQEETFEKINSLGLRFKKEVIGWMISHRVAPDTIRYTALYVQPEHQYRGSSIRLLVDAIALQQSSPIRWALFEINLQEASSSWLKFVLKRLAPYAQESITVLQRWKTLNTV